jgi:hypothetical protein
MHPTGTLTRAAPGLMGHRSCWAPSPGRYLWYRHIAIKGESSTNKSLFPNLSKHTCLVAKGDKKKVKTNVSSSPKYVLVMKILFLVMMISLLVMMKFAKILML